MHISILDRDLQAACYHMDETSHPQDLGHCYNHCYKLLFCSFVIVRHARGAQSESKWCKHAPTWTLQFGMAPLHCVHRRHRARERGPLTIGFFTQNPRDDCILWADKNFEQALSMLAQHPFWFPKASFIPSLWILTWEYTLRTGSQRPCWFNPGT